MKRFENKVCLVTGASSGIGRATALSFAEEGAKVVVADINETTGIEVVNEINSTGGEAIFVKCNIGERQDIVNLITTTVDTFGRLDCAVNCAGIAGKVSKPVHEYPEEDWLLQIQINLIGTWYCVKFQLEQMLKQGGGTIVCVSSAAGLVGQPENSPYAASKHGVNGLVKSAAIEYATKNIRVNAICPTAIETPMIMQGRRKLAENPEALQQAINFQRMKRMGQPQEVADVALWLSSEQSSFITGHTMAVDGGAFA
ncbi:NAD(P)-dependent dehydrogenase (short-subunit alcohol dehydrogenase family) [Arcicella aurantiaca]|uniref:NAD(P)-dependent dehydrogenase (Short-subunit alcohol dehydrogenase family) n=1 Tax=Arcicella aurantiaca TaxID=591202 RepID=A0A316E537_9BACT|nr:glucose 1-dehydrogenase [Arcicella aurantiaca]PWK18040.1 NAD(P)-dependent dehydrogenase (short-subunit alcohol dehydrogenase family) [Arcicella aurantiaca]